MQCGKSFLPNKGNDFDIKIFIEAYSNFSASSIGYERNDPQFGRSSLLFQPWEHDIYIAKKLLTMGFSGNCIWGSGLRFSEKIYFSQKIVLKLRIPALSGQMGYKNAFSLKQVPDPKNHEIIGEK